MEPQTPTGQDALRAAHARAMAGVRVCVTGGAGFIGSHLVEALVAAGADVSVLDDFSTGREVNLSAVASRVRIVAGSMLDPAALDVATAGARVIFHLAAQGSVPASVDNPVLTHAVNAEGTLRVLEAARRHGATRFIYSASSSAYGNATAMPISETRAPDPLSPYAATKLAAEHMVRAWSCCYGLAAVSLRYFNIFGPRQRADSAYAAVVPKWIHALRSGQPIDIFGDGGQTRDFTFVGDAVHANLLAATAPPNSLVGQAINIGSGRSRSLLELLEVLERTIGGSAARRFHASRTGDVRESEADIRAAKQAIGFEPTVSFDEGLRRTIEAGREPAIQASASRERGR